MECKGGWLEFTCKYPKENEKYSEIKLVHSKKTLLSSTMKNMWENKGNFSLFHDTTTKEVQVVIRQLEHKGSEKYNCKFCSLHSSEEEDEQEPEDEQEVKFGKKSLTIFFCPLLEQL